MSQPTPQQTRTIWSFCVNHGSTGHDHKWWVESGKAGVINKTQAGALLGKIACFKEKPTKEGKADLETMFRAFLPGFKVVSDPFPNGPKAYPTPKKEKQGGRGEQQEQGGDDQGDSSHPDDQDKVKALLEELQEELRKKITPKRGEGIPKGFKTSEDYIPPEEFGEILALSKAGCNVLLTGPAGLGKSRLATELKVAMGLPNSFCISFGGSMRYPQVFGSTVLRADENGNQVSTWEPAPFLQAIQQPGVVVIDEIFSCEGDVTNGLNSILEPGTRSIMTPAGLIKAHPECYVVGTANTNGRSLSNMYTGVVVQDFSLLDRFVEVKMNYNQKVEAKLLERLEDPEVETWIRDRLGALRGKIEENDIPFAASTRKLISVIKMVVAGLGAERAFELSFLQPLSRAERLKVGL